MDDLGNMLGGLTGAGGSGGGGGGGIADVFGSLVGGDGGLQGLVGQLTSGGLAEQVGSWVGVGPNKAVAPEQLQGALGSDNVARLVGQSGLPVAQLMPLLAAALPTVVDALTPDGKVPAGNAAAGFDIAGLLEGLGSAAKAGPTSPLAQLGDLLGGNKG